MAEYFLGVDNGGTVAKAALFTVDGHEVAAASSRTELLNPRPTWAEFDMEGLWLTTANSIRRVMAQSGVDARAVNCVACTGHGNGIYLVDAAGRPVRNAIFSSDSRARAITNRWQNEGVDRAVRPKTMQNVWPAQPNALLRWLRDHEPETIRRTKWMLMCKDFIRFRLTGEAYAELTDMSGTSLMNVGTCTYDSEVLATFGISEMLEKLPPLRKSADVCGRITVEAAAQTGLAPGTPVAGGMFDIDACGLSSALTDESQLCMIFGTWGNNQYVSRTPVATEDVFMTSCYSIPGHYLMLEGSATSAGNLEWFISQFMAAELHAAGREEKSIYEIVNQSVAETMPDETGIIFLPFLYGSNSHPDASAALVGMSNRHHRGHVLRAVYEGVIFAHGMHLDRLLRVRRTPERIRASGGAAHSDVWMQMLADAFQIPVEIPEGTELGALGAAICAAVATGRYPSYKSACDGMVCFSRRFDPNPRLADLYHRKFARYKKLLEAMNPAWPDLAQRKTV